jgi:protein-tyrosine sulfotransferase
MELDDTYVIQKIITSPPMRVLDNLIYQVSKKELNSNIFAYKMLLLTQNLKSVSDSNLVVIGGCPRSGTTLVRSLIGMHPKIASPQAECHFLYYLKYPSVLKFTFDFSSKEIEDIKKEFSKGDYIQYLEYLLGFYMRKEGKDLVAFKAPVYVAFLNTLFHRFPNMRFIHCIRDGRDVACSLRTFPKRMIVNKKIVPVKIKNPFAWCVRSWVAHVNSGRKYKGSERYIEVKYEDIVREPITGMKRVFDFLDLKMPDGDKLLSYYKFEKDEKHPQNIEIGRPIYEKSIGRWKTDMSDSEKKQFKKMAGKLLIDLGYEKDLDW